MALLSRTEVALVDERRRGRIRLLESSVGARHLVCAPVGFHAGKSSRASTARSCDFSSPLIAADLVRVGENGHALPLSTNSLDEPTKVGQGSFDSRGVSVANVVERLNERVRVVAQLPNDGIRLVDKLDDCAAGICAGAPNRGASELGDPLDPLRIVWRGEVHNSRLALAGHHSARELTDVEDLAGFSASVLHL
jgi:hypothetical protein